MENNHDDGQQQSIGSQVKGYVSNSNWWLGVFGNIVATMLGILLTVGVGAWVNHSQDRKEAREMMFQVVKTLDDNSQTIASYDSIFRQHFFAGRQLVALYMNCQGDLSTVPEDTISQYVGQLFTFTVSERTRSYVDNYFFSAQMMHQFGNPGLYNKFASSVQDDKKTFEQIEAMCKMNTDIIIHFTNYQIREKTFARAAQALVEDGCLTVYLENIQDTNLGEKAKHERFYRKSLLRLMGATEEDYDDYKESLKQDNAVDDEELYESESTLGGVKKSVKQAPPSSPSGQ